VASPTTARIGIAMYNNPLKRKNKIISGRNTSVNNTLVNPQAISNAKPISLPKIPNMQIKKIKVNISFPPSNKR
jgi:hypothetical protein